MPQVAVCSQINTRLFSDKYKTHKYSVGRTYSCWMLNCWCITWPVGFKRLKCWYITWPVGFKRLNNILGRTINCTRTSTNKVKPTRNHQRPLYQMVMQRLSFLYHRLKIITLVRHEGWIKLLILHLWTNLRRLINLAPPWLHLYRRSPKCPKWGGGGRCRYECVGEEK